MHMALSWSRATQTHLLAPGPSLPPPLRCRDLEQGQLQAHLASHHFLVLDLPDLGPDNLFS